MPELTRCDGEDLPGGHFAPLAHGNMDAAPRQLCLRRACGQPAQFIETVRNILQPKRRVAPGALIRVVTGLSKLLASMMGGVSKAWVREATACSSAQL